jgi:TonB family protein
MKMKSVILSAAILGGLFSVSSFANVIVATSPISAPAIFEAPVPVKVVNPTGLFRRHEGETVKLSLTVDAAGQPHDIRILAGRDQNLTERLLPAVAQWKFIPAKKDGVPVSSRIVLPVQLVDGPVS